MFGAQLALIALLMIINHLVAVDRSNFKTCEQSGFCRRNRGINIGKNKWIIPNDSIKLSSDGESVQFELKNKANGVLFEATISSLLSGQTFRLQVDEIKSAKKRFDAGPLVLMPNLKQSKVLLRDKSNSGFTVEVFDEVNKQMNKLVLNVDPFRIDVYSGDDWVIVGNQRNLFNFEHHRSKGKSRDCKDSCWEERFKDWTDTKPNGPMSVGMDFTFIDFEHVYGIPSHADSFSLKNTKGTDPYRLYNVDIFEYEMYSPMSLYGAYPLMVAHSAAPKTIGLFWLNPSETWIDIDSSKTNRMTHWFSETGTIDVFFLLGPSVSQVMSQNAQLLGTTALPPIYSIGYHQCRWNYFTTEEVMDVDNKADIYDIPMDSIWLDVEYTEGRSKKYFTWDPITFKDHISMIKNLTAKGRRLIAIIDPHLKKESSYSVYKEVSANGYAIKDPRYNKEFEGHCWPGNSVWPDYLNPEVRGWWADKFMPKHFPGCDECLVDIWNDMNEPSVFSGPEITAHRDLLHLGNVEHREIHNIYGFLMTTSTHNGLVKHRPNLRPFILTRSFYAGSQRTAAVWTGDNMSKWEHLKVSIAMLLSHSITGISFIGADIAGFFYNPESEELVIRWYQASVFHPFMRAHAHLDTKRREPWYFSEFTRNTIRDVIRTRYTYLPYMYSLFRENELNGIPPMRPLWMHFPTDSQTLPIDTTYLLGSDLLIAPVLDKGVKKLNLYLPKDSKESTSWLNVWTRKVLKGGQNFLIDVDINSLPIFQRSGSIIPKRERLRRAAVLAVNDPISLQIFANSKGEATGFIYLDDGQSYDYRTKNAFVSGKFLLSKRTLNYSFEEGTANSTLAWLERVTIYWYLSKPNRVFAQLGHADNSKTTQLAFKYDSKKKILVIRKPALPFGQNWQIKIA